MMNFTVKAKVLLLSSTMFVCAAGDGTAALAEAQNRAAHMTHELLFQIDGVSGEIASRGQENITPPFSTTPPPFFQSRAGKGAFSVIVGPMVGASGAADHTSSGEEMPPPPLGISRQTSDNIKSPVAAKASNTPRKAQATVQSSTSLRASASVAAGVSATSKPAKPLLSLPAAPPRGMSRQSTVAMAAPPQKARAKAPSLMIKKPVEEKLTKTTPPARGRRMPLDGKSRKSKKIRIHEFNILDVKLPLDFRKIYYMPHISEALAPQTPVLKKQMFLDKVLKKDRSYTAAEAILFLKIMEKCPRKGYVIFVEDKPTDHLVEGVLRYTHSETIVAFKDLNTVFQAAQIMEYTIGDIRKAIDMYRNAAERGHADAQFLMGEFYENAEHGFPDDLDMAFLWYRKAAQQGHLESIRALEGYDEAIYTEAERASWTPEPVVTAADIYFDGICAEERGDRDATLASFMASSKMGSAKASYNLGSIYENGEQGLKPNLRTALKYYNLAIKQGNEDAKEARDDVIYEMEARGQL